MYALPVADRPVTYIVEAYMGNKAKHMTFIIIVLYKQAYKKCYAAND